MMKFSWWPFVRLTVVDGMLYILGVGDRVLRIERSQVRNARICGLDRRLQVRTEVGTYTVPRLSRSYKEVLAFLSADGTLKIADDWRQIAYVWRVWMPALILGLLVPPVCTYLLEVDGDVTLLAASVSVVLAMGAGLAWHLGGTSRRKVVAPGGLAFLVGIAVTLGVALAVANGLHLIMLGNRVDALRELRPESIDAIAVYSRDDTLLANVTDRRCIDSFVAACRGVEACSPEHPKDIDRWYIVIEGSGLSTNVELQINRTTTGAVGDFVDLVGGISSVRYHGSFVAEDLLEWIERQTTHTELKGTGAEFGNIHDNLRVPYSRATPFQSVRELRGHNT